MLALSLSVPTAEAAPYRASCTTGVLAPQLCTFVLSGVITRVAGVGQYAVVTHVRTSRDASACPDGWYETYAGRVRTRARFRSSSTIADVSVTLRGCPDSYPSVSAITKATIDGGDGTWHVTMDVVPGSGGPRATFVDDWNYENPPGGWDDLTKSDGTLFRRDTGVRGDTTGTHRWCDDADAGSSHGCLSYADESVTIKFDSSISGHWARFYITSSSERGEDYPKITEARSQPYGNGWKITRLS